MTRTLRIAALAALLAACGDDGADGDGGGGAPLSPELAGTWVGTATLTVEGVEPIEVVGERTVTVSGSTATVSGICLDGTGAVTLTGSGDEAAWTGRHACPPAEVGICPEVTLTFDAVTLALEGDTLHADAAGSASGCFVTRDFTVALVGTKAP